MIITVLLISSSNNDFKDTKQNQINNNIKLMDDWIEETEKLSKVDFSSLINDYGKSFDIANKQKEKRLKISQQYIIPTFQIKLQQKQSIKELASNLSQQQIAMKQISLKLETIKDTIIRLQDDMKKNVAEMVENVKF